MVIPHSPFLFFPPPPLRPRTGGSYSSSLARTGLLGAHASAAEKACSRSHAAAAVTDVSQSERTGWGGQKAACAPVSSEPALLCCTAPNSRATAGGDPKARRGRWVRSGQPAAARRQSKEGWRARCCRVVSLCVMPAGCSQAQQSPPQPVWLPAAPPALAGARPLCGAPASCPPVCAAACLPACLAGWLAGHLPAAGWLQRRS
jgi:hypothetical protein